MPSGAVPGAGVLFSIVGRNAEVDESLESSLLDAESIEVLKLNTAIAATAITASEGIQLRTFDTDGDCILTGDWL